MSSFKPSSRKVKQAQAVKSQIRRPSGSVKRKPKSSSRFSKAEIQASLVLVSAVLDFLLMIWAIAQGDLVTIAGSGFAFAAIATHIHIIMKL